MVRGWLLGLSGKNSEIMFSKEKYLKVKRAFLDALFPIHCLGCGKEGKWACPDCMSSIRLMPMYLCPGCGRSAIGGITHDKCKKLTPLNGLISPYHYANPLVRKLIKEYKYHGAKEIGQIISGLTSSGSRALFTLLPTGAKVVAMPLHSSRERWRGFNQTTMIGQTVADVLRASIASPLKRVKKTEEQARLSVAERAKNCNQAFVCERIRGDIILVDDVITSGATLRAAAEALKKAGASRITGFAFAHGQSNLITE